MVNGNTAVIYHYTFVKGAYKCNSIEATETAAQYKLKTDSGAPSYRVVIKKADLNKITSSNITYEMFSTENNPKRFSALLFDIFMSNRTLLQQQIAEIEKEIQILTTIS